MMKTTLHTSLTLIFTGLVSAFVPNTAHGNSMSQPTALRATKNSPEARRSVGHDLFEHQQYEAAARVFENLWAEHHVPEDLRSAAAARFAAGHFAHAVAEYSTYLAEVPPQARSRKVAASQLQAARSKCYNLEVKLRTPYDHGDFQLIATRISKQAMKRPPLPIALEPAAGKRTMHVHQGGVPLDPGSWQLTLTGPYGFSETRTVEVADKVSQVYFETGIKNTNSRKAALALMLSSPVTTISGAVLVGVGFSRIKQAERGPTTVSDKICPNSNDEAYRLRCQRAELLVAGIGMSGGGLALLGLGVGGIASGATHWITSTQKRRITQLSLLGAGVAGTIGGTVGLAFSIRSGNRALDDLSESDNWETPPYSKTYPAYAASSFFTGLSASLMVGSAIMLLVTKQAKKSQPTTRLSPSFTRGFAGFELMGSF